jgi:hypothetical protein
MLMSRHVRFEEFRWVGDKRTQVVHDQDACEAEILDELMEAQTFIGFGPDTLAEARNRCYRPCEVCASGASSEH